MTPYQRQGLTCLRFVEEQEDAAWNLRTPPSSRRQNAVRLDEPFTPGKAPEFQWLVLPCPGAAPFHCARTSIRTFLLDP